MVSIDWLLFVLKKHCIAIAVQKSCIHASAVAVFEEWWIFVFVDIVSFHRGTLGASLLSVLLLTRENAVDECSHSQLVKSKPIKLLLQSRYSLPITSLGMGCSKSSSTFLHPVDGCSRGQLENIIL